jgi:hypothetical protein
MARARRSDALLERSRFVFRGTVTKLGASNVKLLHPSDKTAVVRVEDVYRGNEATNHLQGREVTVLLRRVVGDEAGKTLIFFSNGFLFGENVAVREVERRDPSAQTDTLLARIPEFELDMGSRPLAERVGGAEAVIIGKVVGLREESRKGFRSEHDPDWWVATVQVTSSVRGRKLEGSVEVLFANSRDIAWYESPKFRAGNFGIISLRKEKVADLEKEYYVATHPLDLLPLDRLGEVKLVASRKRRR